MGASHCLLPPISADSLCFSPVGAASSVPWAQAHADQAALALAASRWLTKEITLIEPQLVEPSMAWIQGRLDRTSCVGRLCARRPAHRRVRGRGLAPTAFKMSPLSGLKSHRSSVKALCCTVAETPVS